jgi:hypothetical protein
VTGWFAFALIVAVVIATAAIFAAGRKAGAAEAAKAREAELKSLKEASDAKDRMLDAAARRPRDRSDLADRLRDGHF